MPPHTAPAGATERSGVQKPWAPADAKSPWLGPSLAGGGRFKDGFCALGAILLASLLLGAGLPGPLRAELSGGAFLPAFGLVAGGALLLAAGLAVGGGLDQAEVSGSCAALPLVAGACLLPGPERRPGCVAGGAWVVAQGLVSGRDLLLFLDSGLSRALAGARRGGGAAARGPQVPLAAAVFGGGLVLELEELALGGGLLAANGLPAAPVAGLRLGRFLEPLLKPGSCWEEEEAEPLGGGRLRACCCCTGGLGTPAVPAREGGARLIPTSNAAPGAGRCEVPGPAGVLNSTSQPRDSTWSCAASVSLTVNGPWAALTGAL
jgi:hypothetical protein